MATPYNPLAGIYGVAPAKKKTTIPPGGAASFGGPGTAPSYGGAYTGYPGGPASGAFGNPAGSAPGTGGWVPPPMVPENPTRIADDFGNGRKDYINVMGVPDYRGLLDQYTADWRGRLNTNRANMETQRLGNARGLLNKLGVRDPAAMFAQLGKFGITMDDLQAAADNPWSNLKALDQQAREGRSQGFASRAARGGARSGGTARLAEKVEEQRSRLENQANQDALMGLAEGQNNVQNWYQGEEDAMRQRTFDLEQSLSQRYQPQTAHWDDSQGGYRWGNEVYDQNGTLIRRL